ncbi:type II toxin-antitoxin system VapC family toxin [Halopenitus persicus]|uniref:type II toxin-antitoxin system VapC family toxin n=1 Tax=Halopenitus persicus TaxID=1048396 RepID=UPI000BBAD618|nr:PIN domain-containing protein [Halopenitus persicus]
MTICLDTDVLYADHDLDASRHRAATTALEAVFDGAFGQPYISDYIYDEAVTLTLKRGGSFTPAKHLGAKLRGAESYPDVYDVLHVSRAVFEDAVDVFERYDDRALSFTDATTIALCRRHDIDAVMSFDDDFDGLVDRVAPQTVD